MASEKNFYDILDVPISASLSEIKEAYRYKANILHPDHTLGMPEMTRKKAEAELKLVNVAYETLSNPEKRRQYDIKICTPLNKSHAPQDNPSNSRYTTNENRSTYHQSESQQDIIRQNNPNIPPKVEVYPSNIKIVDAIPFQKVKSYFFVKNSGGKYTIISVSSKQENVTEIVTTSLHKPSKLPMRVDVNAIGTKWGANYTYEIDVRLDDSEAKVKIELHTKKHE
jgi:hypothetical protein